MEPKINVGVISGKWRLIHQGHKELMLRTIGLCNEVHILVVDLPGQKRYSTIEQLEEVISEIYENVGFDNFHIHVITEDLSGEDWDRKVLELVPNIDYIFNSKEDYPNYLIENKFIKTITSIDVSASEIEKDMMKYYDLIAPEFRPLINKGVVITGDRHSGKTILSQKLASYYNTKLLSDMTTELLNIKYIENFLEAINDLIDGQTINVDYLEQEVNKYFIIDTDALYLKFVFNKYISECNEIDEYKDEIENIKIKIEEILSRYVYENMDVIYLENEDNVNEELQKFYYDTGINLHVVNSQNYDDKFLAATCIIDNY